MSGAAGVGTRRPGYAGARPPRRGRVAGAGPQVPVTACRTRNERREPAVSQRRETMVIDDLSGDRPSRSGHRSMADGLRSADPITMALVVGGVLAVVGI